MRRGASGPGNNDRHVGKITTVTLCMLGYGRCASPGSRWPEQLGEGVVMGSGALFIAVFLACAVEAVEATTIVLAAGTARDWRSAVSGLAVALLVLAIVVAVLGPAVSALPLRGLRLVVGA